MTEVPLGVSADVSVGASVDVSAANTQHKRFPPSDGLPASGRASGPYLSSLLSPRDQLIIDSVQRFNQVSANQLLRLYFHDKSPASRQTQCNYVLRRLMKGKGRDPYLRRIERSIGGYRGGSTGYIYIPPTSQARIPNPHTIDIAEVYVRLVERQRLGQCEVLAYEPEWYERVAGVELKPDAMVHLRLSPTRERIAYLEIDRGTQWRTRLAQKMRRYVQAYNLGPDDTPFPRVLFIVPHEDRARFVAGVVKQQEVPQLFTVCQFEEAVDILTA